MMPKRSHNKTRSVSIHYFEDDCIGGFSFFDKEGALLWKIGEINSWDKVGTVVIGENEVIFGVAASLSKHFTYWNF